MTEEEIDKQTLARVDERTKAIQNEIIQLRAELKSAEQQSEHILDIVDKNYTKKADFVPVQKLVYGMVAFLLLSIGGMFISLLARGTVPPTNPPGIMSPK